MVLRSRFDNPINQNELEAATNAFVQGAAHLAENNMSLELIVNALIGAMITVCYTAGEDPHALATSFRKAAEQIPGLYTKQDQSMKGSQH